MNKSGLFLKLTILIIIILAGGFFIYSNIFSSSELPEDTVCVPATCCHPTECVPKGTEQDCAAVSCTDHCEPGTLDCGQASCEFIDGKCEVVENEEINFEG